MDPILQFEGDDGMIRRIHPDRCRLIRRGEVLEEVRNSDASITTAHQSVFENWLDRVTGRSAAAACEVENALETTRLICAVSACSPIHDIAPEHYEALTLRMAHARRAGAHRAIVGIEELFENCYETFSTPHDCGAARPAWAQAAHSLDVRDFEHFTAPFGGW